jgi:hypothetical protein
MPFPRELAYAFFVPAEGQTLVETGVKLTLELTEGPILLAGLYLIEATLFRVVNAEEEDVVRPAQGKGAEWGTSRFARQ